MDEELGFSLNSMEDTVINIENNTEKCKEALEKLDLAFNALEEHMTNQQTLIEIYKEKRSSLFQIIELMKTAKTIIQSKQYELEEKTDYIQNHIEG